MNETFTTEVKYAQDQGPNEIFKIGLGDTRKLGAATKKVSL